MRQPSTEEFIGQVLARALLLGSVLVFHVSCHQIAINEISNSHVEANEPEEGVFNEYLSRDLRNYFCVGREVNDCRVEYELLRKGATQAGTSYPKYYAWVEQFRGKNLVENGAVRLAAADKAEFTVIDFLPSNEIKQNPKRVSEIFPAALVDKIIAKAQSR